MTLELTDREYEILGEVLGDKIFEFYNYDKKRDVYLNCDGLFENGDYMRDIHKLSKKVLSLEKYNELTGK